MKYRTKIGPASVVATFAALGALLLSSCSSSAQAQWTAGPSASGSPSGSASAVGQGQISITPATSKTDVAPGDPVKVSASGAATVTSVTLMHGSTKIAGTLSDDGKSWTSTGKLAFNTKYTVTVAATNATKPTTTTTFTTAKASKTIKVTLESNLLNALKNGGTYGVGQVLIAHFNHPVSTSQRDSVVASLHVTATPEVEGRWHWVSSTEVDYRGEKYWASGTTLTLNADLYGVQLSKGVYGQNTTKATIHIGASHILVADNKTHREKVYINGKLVKTIKVSMGMGGSTIGDQGQKVNYWTRTGPHIVMEKSPTVIMSSASYGVSNPNSPFFYAPETIKWAARISYSGEFVHGRDWSVGDIGVRNTSHGCVNEGMTDAKYTYNLLIPGDIVDVVNSPVPISFANTQADWEISWAKW